MGDFKEALRRGLCRSLYCDLIRYNVRLIFSKKEGGMFYFLNNCSVGRKPDVWKDFEGKTYDCKFARFHSYSDGRIQSFAHDLTSLFNDGNEGLFSGDVVLAMDKENMPCKNLFCRNPYFKMVGLKFPENTLEVVARALHDSFGFYNCLMDEIKVRKEVY